jgi:hypothetical protein
MLDDLAAYHAVAHHPFVVHFPARRRDSHHRALVRAGYPQVNEDPLTFGNHIEELVLEVRKPNRVELGYCLLVPSQIEWFWKAGKSRWPHPVPAICPALIMPVVAHRC